MTERTCGDCIACCVYLRIDELNKPGMTHCPYVKTPHPPKPNEAQYTGPGPNNCTVYGTDKRPPCCEGYKCAWLKGGGTEEDRPDKSLMLFDWSPFIENSMTAKPLADGQQDTVEGKAIIERMSKSYNLPVVVLNFYERNILRIEGKGV